ncbi:MAG: protein kinase domain-containing protein [Ktedonobacteraceae bacterium]
MVPSSRFCTACGAANQAQDAFCFNCGLPLRATIPSPNYLVAGSPPSNLTGLLPPNLMLKQRYRILSQLGKGGFSAVYKAEDIQFGNRLLAVKEMSQSGLNPQEIVEATDAFKHEALLLASLKHPHLPSIYDHFSEAGRWYLVMDFIEGETLEKHLNNAKGKCFSVEEVLQIGIQLCSVLGYLHTRQPAIIFRDLKPANIMLTPEGHLYLIDFGIARHFKPGQTKDTIAFGSPGYAAPEQYGKTQSTPRTDIYSLGVTLHQLLTGIDPSQTPFQFAPLQLQGQPAVLELERLIIQMLDMNENKRPDSMAAIKQELHRIIAQQPIGQMNTPQSSISIQSVTPLSSSAPLAQTNNPGVYQLIVKAKNTGIILHKAKRYGEALSAFEQALRLDSKDASIYNFKGVVLCDLKRYNEALAAFEETLQFDPGFAMAYSNKGVALSGLKRYHEALDACEQAIRLDPNLPSGYKSKAEVLYHLKRYQEALPFCDYAIQLSPNDALIHNFKGNVLFNLNRYNEALAAFEQAIRLNPRLAVAYANKSGALKRLGRSKEAQVAYKRAQLFGYNG